MKYEEGGVATEEFVELKRNTYSFLVDESSTYNKGKCVNKNIAARIRHSEYNNVLLNN